MAKVYNARMELRTLGKLELPGVGFTQPKPLVLLSYLALEGPQRRTHLAELFWPDGESRKSLSMALTRLRQGAGEIVKTDQGHVRTTLDSDSSTLLTALGRSDWQTADTLYRGAFLEGVVLDWSVELEEWVYTTREFLAERVRHGLLELSENAVRTGAYSDAQHLAERAYHLPGAPPAEAGTLERLYHLLVASESLFAPKARRELEEYGLDMQVDSQTARAGFRSPTPPSPLPLRTTSFVGREVELLEVQRLLGQPGCQLLTLLGSAGIGKTRLALQVAQAQQTAGVYPGGVYFAPLETARVSTLLPQLAQVLGHTLTNQDDPVGDLGALLEAKETLIVLDNFEHLSGAATLLSALVTCAPKLTLLVTSRVRLNLEEEHLFLLEGLAYPTQSASPDEATGFGAVQLFGQRARQLRPDFDLGRELPAVLELCALLGGSPLGLELAAGWVRFLPCAQIVQELRRDLDFLTSSTAGVPERHRSLRAAFDYSWQLLQGKEQETLASLSVFRGGFTREAASDVVGATIPRLVSLLDRSLIRLPPGGRFEQHPLIAQYVGEKLREQAELWGSSRARHAAYFMEVVRELDAAVQAGQQDTALRDLEAEWANIRAAFEYSLERRDSSEVGRTLELLEMFHDTRGSYTEALAFLESAETLLRTHGPGTLAVLEVLGGIYSKRAWFELRLGRYDPSRASVQMALQTLSETSPWRVSAFNTLSILERRRGAYTEAKAACEMGLALARRHPSENTGGASGELIVAKMLASLADVEEALGDRTASEGYFLEALALYRKHHQVLGVVRNLNNLGWLYYVSRRLEEARTVFKEGVRLAREIGHRQTLPYLLNNLGYIALEGGHYGEAQRLNEEALELAQTNGERAVQAEILTSLARGALALGQLQVAATHVGAGLRLAWEVAYVGLILQALLTWGELFERTGEPDRAAKLAFLVTHHPASTEVEQAGVTALLGRLEAELNAEHLELAATEGQKAILEEVVTELLAHEPSSAHKARQDHPDGVRLSPPNAQALN